MNALEIALRSALEPYHTRGYEVSYSLVDYGCMAEVSFKITGRAVATAVVCSNEEYLSRSLHNLSILTDIHVAARAAVKDAPPWAAEESAHLAQRADALFKDAALLNDKLDDSMGSDFKVFKAMGKAARNKEGSEIIARLTGNWVQHTEWHYSVTTDGVRVELWPSTCKAAAHLGDGAVVRATGARNVSQLLRNYGVFK